MAKSPFYRFSRHRPQRYDTEVSQSNRCPAGNHAMKCPFCHHDNDRVIDSRLHQDGYSIRRRRQCLSCKRRYTTHEHTEPVDLKVVKKDEVREPFKRDKIYHGLAKACWKRPISDDQIQALVAEIEHTIYDRNENEINSREIGEMLMDRLRSLDQVAFVRFASVYREFKDVRDFVDELQPMLDGAAGLTPRGEDDPVSKNTAR